MSEKSYQKTKRRRVSTGCLPCRKRKIKCDEGKSDCANCIKSGVLCEWTLEKQTLEKLTKYKIIKNKNKKTKFINVTTSYIKYQRSQITLDFLNSKSKNIKEINSNNNENNLENRITAIKSTHFDNSMDIVTQNYEDALFRKYLQTIGERYFSKFNFMVNKFPILGINMTNEELKLFDAFSNGFMVAISPQLAHENLQPSAVVIPRGINNSALRSVFYTCGATYLSWNNKELRSYAEEKYQNSLNAIQNHLINSENIGGNEDWLLITMVTFCLREKYQCHDTTRNGLFLIASLEIIKYWINIKKTCKMHSMNECFVDDIEVSEYFDQCELQSKLHEICNQLSKLTSIEQVNNNINHTFISLKTSDDKINSSDLELVTKDDIFSEIDLYNYDISPFERTMIESFLFNYSVNLLNFKPELIKYIDSPFKVFKNLKPFLKQSIYKCPVRWMNNPIMGAGLPAFELAAKSNWLRLQYPLNEENYKTATKLRNLAKYYTSPFLPDTVKFQLTPGVQRKLMESCYVGNMTAMASFILFTKIIYPNCDSYNEEIQDALEIYFKNLKILSRHSQAGATCIWSLIIIGLVIRKKKQLDYLLYRVRTFGEMKKSEALLRVLCFLESAWESEGDSWNILLVRDGFKDLFI